MESNENQSLINLGRALAGVLKNPHAGGRDFITVPKADGSMEIVYLDRPDFPHRLYGTIEVYDVPSFIAATNRHHDPDASVIYASLDPAAFIAVLNDHKVDSPGWRDHRASLMMKHAKEFNGWMAKNKSPMQQEEFAYFIEDNMPDFSVPTGAKMLEVALSFRVKQGMHFKSGIRLQDGTVNFEYTEQNEAGAGATGKVAIPERFRIQIPVWAGLGAKKYEFEAVFRWSVKGGELAMRYELQRPLKVVEKAFEETLAVVKDGVDGCTLIFGKP